MAVFAWKICVPYNTTFNLAEEVVFLEFNYHIALDFRGSLILQILRIYNHSQKLTALNLIG